MTRTERKEIWCHGQYKEGKEIWSSWLYVKGDTVCYIVLLLLWYIVIKIYNNTKHAWVATLLSATKVISWIVQLMQNDMWKSLCDFRIIKFIYNIKDQ